MTSVALAGEFDEASVAKLSLRNRGLRHIPPVVGRCTALTTLCLAGNELTSLRGLQALIGLTALDVSRNSLSTLGRSLPNTLVRIDARANALESLEDIVAVSMLSALHSLDVRGNPVASHSHADVLTMIPSLCVLNGASVALKRESAQHVAELNALLPPAIDDSEALDAILAECGDPRWLGAQLEAQSAKTSDAAGVASAVDGMFAEATEAVGGSSDYSLSERVAEVMLDFVEGGEEALAAAEES